MPRVVHRQVTTIQITSVEVRWEDEREQVASDQFERAPTISEAEKSASASAQKRKPHSLKSSKTRKRNTASQPIGASQKKDDDDNQYPPHLPEMQTDRSGTESDQRVRGEHERVEGDIHRD